MISNIILYILAMTDSVESEKKKALIKSVINIKKS